MQPSSSTALAAPRELPEILLVEDEEVPRRELKRALVKRGFRVREAVDADGAIQQVDQGEVGLVLMDILLGDGPDGIEAAQQIQRIHPDTSVVFVSAYAHEPEYQQRAQGIPRIGGWIDKPIRVAKIPELLRISGKELIKSRLRGRLQGQDRIRQLAELEQDPSVSSEIVEELRQEFPSDPPTQEGLAMQIDAVYDEIRAVVANHDGDPASLGQALQALRQRLRVLQEQEADLMEQRLRSHFRFDPREGTRLIQAARALLKGDWK